MAAQPVVRTQLSRRSPSLHLLAHPCAEPVAAANVHSTRKGGAAGSHQAGVALTPWPWGRCHLGPLKTWQAGRGPNSKAVGAGGVGGRGLGQVWKQQHGAGPAALTPQTNSFRGRVSPHARRAWLQGCPHPPRQEPAPVPRQPSLPYAHTGSATPGTGRPSPLSAVTQACLRVRGSPSRLEMVGVFCVHTRTAWGLQEARHPCTAGCTCMCVCQGEKHPPTGKGAPPGPALGAP